MRRGEGKGVAGYGGWERAGHTCCPWTSAMSKPEFEVPLNYELRNHNLERTQSSALCLVQNFVSFEVQITA